STMFWPKLPRARARNQQERINPVRRASRRGRYRGIGQDAVGTHCAFAPKHFTNVPAHFTLPSKHFTNASTHFTFPPSHFTNAPAHFAFSPRHFTNAPAHFAFPQ